MIMNLTIDGVQELLPLMLPFELGDTGFFGDGLQFSSGLVALLEEMAGVAVSVPREANQSPAGGSAGVGGMLAMGDAHR